MQVEKLSYTPSKKVNFQGAPFAKLFEVIPDTKVCKNLTEADKKAFHAYLVLKKFTMGISPEEVKQLEKFDGDDFILNSYEFLTKKLGLDESVRPVLMFYPIANQSKMAYVPLQNIIFVDKAKLNDLKKGEIFGYIRHELQHYLQNSSVLRHETYGKMALDEYTKSFISAQRQLMEQNFLKMSADELINSGMLASEDSLAKIEYLKTLYAKNDTQAIDAFYKEMGEGYRGELEAIRDVIINKFGVIKDDSAQTEKIGKYFDEFKSSGYYNADGTIDTLKYLNSGIELEALSTQSMASSEFFNICPVREIKNEMLEAVKDPDIQKIEGKF